MYVDAKETFGCCQRRLFCALVRLAHALLVEWYAAYNLIAAYDEVHT
jgi:hypothetical protein